MDCLKLLWLYSAVLFLDKYIRDKLFLSPEILLPVSVLFFYSVFACQYANDFNTKECGKTNTGSAHEYNMFMPAHLLCNWQAVGQQPG
jgi:hypothetical protein